MHFPLSIQKLLLIYVLRGEGDPFSSFTFSRFKGLEHKNVKKQMQTLHVKLSFSKGLEKWGLGWE